MRPIMPSRTYLLNQINLRAITSAKALILRRTGRSGSVTYLVSIGILRLGYAYFIFAFG